MQNSSMSARQLNPLKTKTLTPPPGITTEMFWPSSTRQQARIEFDTSETEMTSKCRVKRNIGKMLGSRCHLLSSPFPLRYASNKKPAHCYGKKNVLKHFAADLDIHAYIWKGWILEAQKKKSEEKRIPEEFRIGDHRRRKKYWLCKIVVIWFARDDYQPCNSCQMLM